MRSLMPTTVALILGNPRSGSTLLGAMLGSHSEAVMLGEMDRYPSALRRRRASFKSGRLCEFCAGACPLWDRAVPKHFALRHFSRAAPVWHRIPGTKSLYEELRQATGAKLLVDSSKNARWARRRLADGKARDRLDIGIVFVTRDGRAAVNSWARKQPEVPIEAHVDAWTAKVRECLDVYDEVAPNDRVTVKYEDLVDDPEARLAELCRFLGVAPEPGMSRYWEHEHHIFNGNEGTLSLIRRWRRENRIPVQPDKAVSRDQTLYRESGLAIFNDQRWKAEMSVGEQDAFEAGAGDLNRSLGYS